MLVIAPAALASGPAACDGDGWFDFGLTGSVTAVNADAGILTVAVEHGSDGLSGTVNVVVTEDTCLLRAQHHERTSVELTDVTAGDRVTILGTTDDSSGETVYTAAVVCVRAPCFGLVGTVTAVDADAGTLSVAVDEASGGLTGTIDILVTADTRIVRGSHEGRGCDDELTLDDVTVGDGVGVWGTIDSSSGKAVYTADKVCLRVPRFGLVGAVTAVDGVKGLVTVAIGHASGELSGSIDVAVTGDTELYAVADHERTPITLADVAVDDEVAVFGTIDSSTGSRVYTAHVLLDGISADWLPKPSCKLHDAAVDARDAKKGDRLKLRLKVADAMPGCPTARVSISVKTSAGRTVATRNVVGVAVNRQVTVALKLGRTLRHGSYRLVATSTDWAGNTQARARTAVLKIK
jgi:5-hydroxyisourate hydrolase-like protein (transthyretin family)